MIKKLLFCGQLLLVACLFTVAGYAAPYNFQFGVQSQGGVNFGGPLGVYPSGFGTPACSAVTANHTYCSGSNVVGAGIFVGLALFPGGVLSDPSTWNALLLMTPNNANLYANDPGNNFVQILINAGYFFNGIQPSQYATYLGGANKFTQSTPTPVIDIPSGGFYSYQIFTSPNPTSVPEPSSLMLILSSGALALARRRKLASNR